MPIAMHLDVADLESNRSMRDEKAINVLARPNNAPRRSAVQVAWMALVNDEDLVSSLSIPGTHDSAAYTQPWPFVATQTMNIAEQLHAGIRYFDLRCGVVNNSTEMVHGPRLLGLRLQTVLDTMYTWLDSHPTEGLIVQIKEDRKSEQSTIPFWQAIYQNIAAKSERWRTANTTPSMGELRGKIQLLRRYSAPSRMAYGIDVTQWQVRRHTPFWLDVFPSTSANMTISFRRIIPARPSPYIPGTRSSSLFKTIIASRSPWPSHRCWPKREATCRDSYKRHTTTRIPVIGISISRVLTNSTCTTNSPHAQLPLAPIMDSAGSKA